MQPLIDYSLAGEPLLFSQFLPTSARLVLIDVDAGDGLTGSLSRELIDKGWRALLIEREPKLFRQLSENSSGIAHVELDTQIRMDGFSNIGLLILNKSEIDLSAWNALDLARLCPLVIVINDGKEASEERTNNYDLLSRAGYVYSGLAGSYSIWQSPSNEPPFEVKRSVSLPPKRSADARGQAFFDPLPGDFEASATRGPREVMISGWAIAGPDERVPPWVWIEVSDQTSGRREYVQAHRYWRPDVNARFKRQRLGMSGFRTMVPLGGKRPKSTLLRVLQADQERTFHSDAELLLNTNLQSYEQTAREGLARKFLSGSGIEIGALQRPLSIPRGCQVRYVDRISVNELRSHYPELSQFPLQAPDFLDDGETLEKIAAVSQDFVIANHFFEHSENPVQTLSNLLRVVKPGGILYMGIPDKRFTFDFDRPVTSYEVLKATYETNTRPDRNQLFEEWAKLAERRTGLDADARIAELRTTNYSIHYNVWTFDDLLSFLLRARSDFNLPFRMASAVCCDNEAIIILERI